MFDQNGIWQDDIYHAPGPSGGATGALDLMNVMQSGQNYQKDMALEALKKMLAMSTSPNAPAAFQSPQMPTATGLSPEEVQNFYGQTQQGKFGNYVTQNPNATQEDLYNEEARLNMVTPSSLGTQVRQKSSDENKRQREILGLNFKQRKALYDLVEKNRALGIEDPVGQALSDLGQLGGEAPTIAPSVAPVPAANIGVKKATTDFIKGPKTALTKAQTAFTLTKDTWYPLIASAESESLLSSAGHKDALVASTDLASAIKAQEAEGALTPQGRVETRRKAAMTADALRRLQDDPIIQDEIKRGSPDGMQWKMTMQAMAHGIKEGNKIASTAPSVQVKKPAAETAATQPKAVTTKTVAPDDPIVERRVTADGKILGKTKSGKVVEVPQ